QLHPGVGDGGAQRVELAVGGHRLREGPPQLDRVEPGLGRRGGPLQQGELGEQDGQVDVVAQAGGGHGRPPVAASRPCCSPASCSRISAAASLGVLPTFTPAASRASCLAWAVPAEPGTIAPAWPMVLPSGAVNPATWPTTGLGTWALMSPAARSSASPPISPIITIARVSGSASNASSASMWVVPITGSPPMPIAVEKPYSRSSYIIW